MIPSVRFRPIWETDLDQLEQLSHELEPGNAGAFHTHRDGLQQIIQESMASFTQDVQTPGPEIYVFVLEDMIHRRLMGMIKLTALANRGNLFYSYQIQSLCQISVKLQVNKTLPTLHLVSNYTDASSMSSLVLFPRYRKKGMARLLLVALHLYPTEFPQRFPKRMIGEIRGCYDSSGCSVFWKHVVQHFIKDMDYPTYLQLLSDGMETEILGLLPRGPIYISLLSAEVRQVIGKPHADSRGVIQNIKAMGFSYQEHVGYSSAAPIYECNISRIQPIEQSREAVIEILASTVSGRGYLISNQRAGFDFAVTVGKVCWLSPQSIGIEEGVGQILKLQAGDRVRMTEFNL